MNNINLTQEELSNLSKLGTIEIYTEKQFNSFIEMNEDLAKSAEIEELDEIQKSDYEEFVAEIQSFSKTEVFGFKEGSNYLVEKSICYIRPKQVEWTEEEVIEKSESGEEIIVKAKTGIYTDTGLNRKLGRVGAKYGSKKEKEESSIPKKEVETEKKTVQWDDIPKAVQKRIGKLERILEDSPHHPQKKEIDKELEELYKPYEK